EGRPQVREQGLDQGKNSAALARSQDSMSTARILPFLADETEPTAETTHEAFVHAVRAAVVLRVNDPALRARLLSAKLVYGGGPEGVRGLCYFGAWQNGAAHDFIEIAALGEESYIQLAGRECGHGAGWKAAAAVLGLQLAQAGGQEYSPEHFDPRVWAAIEALPHPSDGRPGFAALGLAAGPVAPPRVKPCPLGVGTRGGRSRGAGSGSRLRLWLCGCPEGTVGRKVRVASDDWDATCNRCGSRYQKDGRPA